MAVPEIQTVEIVAAKPDGADQRRIAHLEAATDRALDAVMYVVKVHLKQPIPATGNGFTLFVGSERIGRYTAFPGGVYFKVHDPNFLVAHRGEPIRFSAEAEIPPAMSDSGSAQAAFPANPVSRTKAADHAGLPSLRDVLSN